MDLLLPCHRSTLILLKFEQLDSLNLVGRGSATMSIASDLFPVCVQLYSSYGFELFK